MSNTIIINGREFKTSALSPEILENLEIMNFSKIKLAELRHDLQFLEKAKNGYLNELLTERDENDRTFEFGVD